MPSDGSSSQDSDSTSDEEVQRLKEAVCEVAQIQPTNAADTAAGLLAVNKKRQSTRRSARYDSEEEEHDIGREIGRDTQQFIARKLAKFLDDTMEIGSPVLATACTAHNVDSRVVPVASMVRVFSQSVGSPEADDGTAAEFTSESNALSRRKQQRCRKRITELWQMSQRVERKEMRRAAADGSSCYHSRSSSSSSSSGSEDEIGRRLALQCVAVSADDVLREREVLHKYGVKRLGKLEVYSARTNAGSAAAMLVLTEISQQDAAGSERLLEGCTSSERSKKKKARKRKKSKGKPV